MGPGEHQVIDHHTKPSDRHAFVRSHREATGYHLPARPLQLYRPAKDPDRIVWRVCAVGFVVLALLMWAGVDI
jgi:hypothetical protein